MIFLKKIISIILIIVISFYCIKVVANKIPEDAIRIRVVANSDSEYDQKVKQKVSNLLKSEMYYLNKFYTTDNLISSIVEYIEFYNNKRFQAILKSLTPIEYRNQALLA